MKKAINILLVAAIIVPVVLLFWPFVMWNDVMSVILRVIPALAAQALLCRISRSNYFTAIPALLTGVFAVWGTYLYFTSLHWSDATLGDLFADYVSPFICCIIILVVYLLKRKRIK